VNEIDHGDSGAQAASLQATICNKKGLHARAAAAFVRCAEEFDAQVNVSRDEETVSGHSIMDLLMLAAAKNTTLTLSATGPEAARAINALEQLIKAGFNESE